MRRGTRVGQAYVALAVDGDHVNDDIIDAMDDAGPGVEEQGKKHGERYSEGFFDRIRNKMARGLSKEFDDAGREGSESFAKHFDDDFGDRLGARIGGHMVAALIEAIDGSLDGGDNPLAELFARWEEGVSGNLGGRGRGRGIGDRIGRLFGAGSRNNFLNFFGRSLGNIVTLVDKIRTGAPQMFKAFSEGFKQAGENAGPLARVLSGFRAIGGGGGLFAGLAGAGPAIATVTLSLSIMVSVVGALVGILTALTSTIVSGLIGALITTGGLLVTLTTAAGLLTAAFMSMTDAQTALLKEAFVPLHQEMIGIGQLMITQMIPYFDTWSSNLQRSLLLLAPLAQEMGTIFGEAGNNITSAFSGPGFQMLADQLGRFLPGIIDLLSIAFQEFINGVAASSAAVVPYIAIFADHLARVAEEFNRWATSAEGQNAISDFVGKALASLESLWNFVKELGGFIGDVLFSDEAMAAGIAIFDAMTAKLGEWRDAVQKAIENGDMQRWFEDAIEFGSAFWSVLEGLWDIFLSLYNSGVLESAGTSFEFIGMTLSALATILTPLIDLLGFALPTALFTVVAPLEAIAASVISIGEAVEWVGGLLNIGDGAEWGNAGKAWKGIGDQFLGLGAGAGARPDSQKLDFDKLFAKIQKGFDKFKGKDFSLDKLIGSGQDALSKTTKDGPKAPYENPYEDFANSLIKDTDDTAARIKNALIEMGKKINEAFRDASTSLDIASTRGSLKSLAESLKSQAAQMVNTAQQALNSAASSLASAGSEKAAEKALREVKKAQDDLETALDNQKRIDTIAKKVLKQNRTSEHHVQRLLKGLTSQNATIGDYVVARTRVTNRLERANEKLANAIAMRDDFKNQVIDSVREFGNLMTAQAQSIGGIEQALTAQDITTNLEDRLTKIRKFQENLRILSSQGLSASAYKQILDAGVDAGSITADALVQGGVGAVQEVNNLVAQVDAAAKELGLETSTRMYQAGVDAAQGLVDGLTSLSTQLDSAAVKLGNSIAAAIRKSLGIKSPSSVLRDMMDYVGDGAVLGLDRQHGKVGAAAASLAGAIAVSPQAAATAGSKSNAEVSGNSDDPRFRDLIVQTPTEDPMAVAHEVLNEVVGRLP